MTMYPRPFIKHDGTRVTVLMPPCQCSNRKGPLGGVCGWCNGAIPNPTEARCKIDPCADRKG